MPKCEMLTLSKNKATCDPSGLWGCPKHKNRDMITPECWRLRRFEQKKPALDNVPKEKIYRHTKVRCPRCQTRFLIREGL